MPKELSVDVQVRPTDVDVNGHVNNAAYFAYMELARTITFKELFLEYLKRGLVFVVARAECDYRTPIQLFDPVTVSVAIASLGRRSSELEYTIHDGEKRLFAKARTVMVCIDRKSQQAVDLPDDLPSRLAQVTGD